MAFIHGRVLPRYGKQTTPDTSPYAAYRVKYKYWIEPKHEEGENNVGDCKSYLNVLQGGICAGIGYMIESYAHDI